MGAGQGPSCPPPEQCVPTRRHGSAGNGWMGSGESWNGHALIGSRQTPRSASGCVALGPRPCADQRGKIKARGASSMCFVRKRALMAQAPLLGKAQSAPEAELNERVLRR